MYKKIIVLAGIFLLLLILVDLVVSRQTQKPSQVAQTLKTIENITNPGTILTTPTPTQTTSRYQGLPKSYKGNAIPTTIYDEALSLYRTQPKSEVLLHMTNTVQHYYIFADYLNESKIPFQSAVPLKWTSMEKSLPEMQNLIEKNLISYMDFAYIKVRFKYAPEEERLKSLYGDLKVKAHDVIEQYRQQFATGIDPETVIAASNQDEVISMLNNGERNSIIKNYLTQMELFFTDKKFNSFLFAQKQGTVSNIYTLRGSTGDEYAYVIVYPIFVQTKQYKNIDEVIQLNAKNFSNY